ncbi:MAG: hypothetical protein D3903_08400, partial [Candidatus Electrothrix sp. GM3_4]|nr:hypothetical protein [Candidatus Electrothrix sp. GM3_4]
LMVMVLSLLVYGIAERRMRIRLAEQQETVPNQINQPTQTPTLRWIFQLMGGISRIKITVGNRVKYVFDGITELKKRILLLFGDGVANISNFIKLHPLNVRIDTLTGIIISAEEHALTTGESII